MPYKMGGSSEGSPKRLSGGGYRMGKPKKKDSDSSIWDTPGNFLRDAEDAILGLGPSLVRTGYGIGEEGVREVRKRPYTIASLPYTIANAGVREMGGPLKESYAYSYGPLVHALDKTLPRGPFEDKLQGSGSYGEFYRRFKEHPLGPVLDVSALFTGGAAAAAKMGLAPAALKRGTLQFKTPGGGIVEKPLPKQVARAELQVATHALMNKLPYGTRVIGEAARAGRQVRKGPLRLARAAELLSEPAQRAFSKRTGVSRLAPPWR